MLTAKAFSLVRKNPTITRVPLDVTVGVAVQAMIANSVGAALVFEDDALVGIITERDLLTKVVGMGKDASTEKVADHMTLSINCMLS